MALLHGWQPEAYISWNGGISKVWSLGILLTKYSKGGCRTKMRWSFSCHQYPSSPYNSLLRLFEEKRLLK